MSGKPIYQEIADQLRDVISSGELAPGDRVPSTSELSAYHSVNPTTSAKALTELFNEGLVRVPVPRRCGRYRRAPSRRNRDRDDRPHPRGSSNSPRSSLSAQAIQSARSRGGSRLPPTPSAKSSPPCGDRTAGRCAGHRRGVPGRAARRSRRTKRRRRGRCCRGSSSGEIYSDLMVS